MKKRTILATLLVAGVLLSMPAVASAHYRTRIVVSSSTLHVNCSGNEWFFLGLPKVPSSSVKGKLQYYSSKRHKWIDVGAGVVITAYETEPMDAMRIGPKTRLRTSGKGRFTYRLPARAAWRLGYVDRWLTLKYSGNSKRKSTSKSPIVDYSPYLMLTEQHDPQALAGSHVSPGPRVSLSALQSTGVDMEAHIYWPGATEADPEYPYTVGRLVIEVQRLNSSGGWIAYASTGSVIDDELHLYDPINATGRYRLRARFVSDLPEVGGSYGRTLRWRYFTVGS